ncbi:MAG: IS481 family transposase [Candidatus Pacebacteria bacterium]|nr:IS481 family transposase [Candidatus Paceibacterota bacterium]
METSRYMCTQLPKDALEERLRWVLPIANKEVKLKEAALLFPGGKRTLERWVSAFKESGEEGLVPKSTRPRTSPDETPIRTKERVIELRKETNLCAKKIHWRLKKEGLDIKERVIGKILKAEGLVRKYRTKKLKWKYIKVPLLPGELIEIDIKYVPDPILGFKYYQYTAIDCASRWRYLKIYPNPDNLSSILFLREVLEIAPFRVRAVKTDNGSCFTNRYTGYDKSTDPLNPRLHDFDLLCQRRNILHYLIDPGKPAQNGKVERSHRTDQERFYSVQTFKDKLDLETKLRQWNEEYNNTEHCALAGKTPNEMLLLYSKGG